MKTIFNKLHIKLVNVYKKRDTKSIGVKFFCNQNDNNKRQNSQKFLEAKKKALKNLKHIIEEESKKENNNLNENYLNNQSNKYSELFKEKPIDKMSPNEISKKLDSLNSISAYKTEEKKKEVLDYLENVKIVDTYKDNKNNYASLNLNIETKTMSQEKKIKRKDSIDNNSNSKYDLEDEIKATKNSNLETSNSYKTETTLRINDTLFYHLDNLNILFDQFKNVKENILSDNKRLIDSIQKVNNLPQISLDDLKLNSHIIYYDKRDFNYTKIASKLIILCALIIIAIFYEIRNKIKKDNKLYDDLLKANDDREKVLKEFQFLRQKVPKTKKFLICLSFFSLAILVVLTNKFASKTCRMIIYNSKLDQFYLFNFFGKMYVGRSSDLLGLRFIGKSSFEILFEHSIILSKKKKQKLTFNKSALFDGNLISELCDSKVKKFELI